MLYTVHHRNQVSAGIMITKHRNPEKNSTYKADPE